MNEPRQGAPATVTKSAALTTGRRGNAPAPRRALLSDSAESVPGPSRALTEESAAPAAPPAEVASETPARTGGSEQPLVRMRQRIARLGSTRPQTPVLDPLFRIVRANHPKADLNLIARAYKVAERCHRGQVRISGDAYITHPLSVTTILAELGMTEPTLCAALLHDTVEDSSYTLTQLAHDFGDEIALLVDGCTKLEKIKYGDSAKAETIRKMILAMSRDIRVLVIKLADRLHNMRTLHYLRPDKQSRIASETLRDLRPAGPSPRHERDQVGARGPVPSRPCNRRSTTRSSGWSPRQRRAGTSS